MKKLIEYAKTLISLSTEYLMDNYDEKLYSDMVGMFSEKMKEELKDKEKENDNSL